jgi:hypothetical protein
LHQLRIPSFRWKTLAYGPSTAANFLIKRKQLALHVVIHFPYAVIIILKNSKANGFLLVVLQNKQMQLLGI